MENQHRKIKGYRELSQGEIDVMNEIKAKAKEVGDLVERLEAHAKMSSAEGFEGTAFDGRWVAIAKTDLQKGFMSLTRAIAKPEFF